MNPHYVSTPTGFGDLSWSTPKESWNRVSVLLLLVIRVLWVSLLFVIVVIGLKLKARVAHLWRLEFHEVPLILTIQVPLQLRWRALGSTAQVAQLPRAQLATPELTHVGAIVLRGPLAPRRPPARVAKRVAGCVQAQRLEDSLRGERLQR